MIIKKQLLKHQTVATGQVNNEILYLYICGALIMNPLNTLLLSGLEQRVRKLQCFKTYICTVDNLVSWKIKLQVF